MHFRNKLSSCVAILLSCLIATCSIYFNCRDAAKDVGFNEYNFSIESVRYVEDIYVNHPNSKLASVVNFDELFKEEDSISIEDVLVIGDSNTVRMNMYNTQLSNAKAIAAIVGVGVSSFDSYKNKSNTTNGLTLKDYLDTLSDDYFGHVVIMLGTNDYGSSSKIITRDYQEITDYIYGRDSKAVINIVTIPPVNESCSNTVRNRAVKIVNEAIKSFVSENMNLIDLNSFLSEKDMSSSKNDGYHLSKSGAEKAANHIVENLK